MFGLSFSKRHMFISACYRSSLVAHLVGITSTSITIHLQYLMRVEPISAPSDQGRCERGAPCSTLKRVEPISAAPDGRFYSGAAALQYPQAGRTNFSPSTWNPPDGGAGLQYPQAGRTNFSDLEIA